MKHPRYAIALLGVLAMTAAVSLAKAESIRNPYYDHIRMRISNLQHEVAELSQKIEETKAMMSECKRRGDANDQPGWAVFGAVTSACAGLALIGQKNQVQETLRELRLELEDVPIYIPESDFDYWYGKVR